jgi:hypothetical protein
MFVRIIYLTTISGDNVVVQRKIQQQIRTKIFLDRKASFASAVALTVAARTLRFTGGCGCSIGKV